MSLFSFFSLFTCHILSNSDICQIRRNISFHCRLASFSLICFWSMSIEQCRSSVRFVLVVVIRDQHTFNENKMSFERKLAYSLHRLTVVYVVRHCDDTHSIGFLARINSTRCISMEMFCSIRLVTIVNTNRICYSSMTFVEHHRVRSSARWQQQQ
jgi:hypothetical protein